MAGRPEGMPIATVDCPVTMSRCLSFSLRALIHSVRAVSQAVPTSRGVCAAVALLLASATAVGAQPPDAAAPSRPAPEIELNLINLPTTQSLGRNASYFRLTHRFA